MSSQIERLHEKINHQEQIISDLNLKISELESTLDKVTMLKNNLEEKIMVLTAN
jgi:uncharacterized coiled-coil protein SlyX